MNASSQRITLPSLSRSSLYYVHTANGSWRGPAVSIYQAFILSRYAGIRGHVFDIYYLGELREIIPPKTSLFQRLLTALGW